MSEKWRNQAAELSGMLGFLVPTCFAYTLYVDKVPQNIATWGMVFVLDFLGLILVYKDGNKKPLLQLGWAVASVCILFAVAISGNPIGWGRTETFSVVLCGVAIWLWISLSARAGLWAYMIAMYVSFFPLMADYWSKPQPDTIWLWLWTILSCLLAVLGAEKRDFTNTFVPWAALVLNTIIAILCIL